MRVKDIVKFMDSWALPQYIDSWDNTGFQIGDPNKKVEKILIALDLDRTILNKAIEENYDMIITHHPLIFKPLESITTTSYKEKLIYDLIKNNISAYNAHTNLDIAENGVNDELAKLLRLENTYPLKILGENQLKELKDYGYGRVGNMKPILLSEYIKVIKDKLSIENLILYGDANKKIAKVAVCGGSGGDFILDAHMENVDLYITGDIKYHDAQLADELGVTLIDAGHFHTEKIILPVIKEFLDKETKKSIIIEVYDRMNLPYGVY